MTWSRPAHAARTADERQPHVKVLCLGDQRGELAMLHLHDFDDAGIGAFFGFLAEIAEHARALDAERQFRVPDDEILRQRCRQRANIDAERMEHRHIVLLAAHDMIAIFGKAPRKSLGRTNLAEEIIAADAMGERLDLAGDRLRDSPADREAVAAVLQPVGDEARETADQAAHCGYDELREHHIRSSHVSPFSHWTGACAGLSIHERISGTDRSDSSRRRGRCGSAACSNPAGRRA